MSDTLKIINDTVFCHGAHILTLTTNAKHDMETKDIITLTISASALIISLFSIWINYLKPFSLRIFNDSPTFSLYKITPQMSGSETEETWWIPSFDIGFSLNNLGKRSGIIYDIRLVCRLNGRQTKKEFQFYSKWIVDYAKFQKFHTERFEWIEESVEKEWFETILPANSSKDFHLILEGDRWENKFNGTFSVVLEIFTSKKKKWVRLREYEWHVDQDMFDDKSTYTLFNKGNQDRRK